MINENEKEGIVSFNEWLKQTKMRHPLPDGAIWLWCNEKSNDFVWARKED